MLPQIVKNMLGLFVVAIAITSEYHPIALVVEMSFSSNPSLNTAFLLMAQYHGAAIIPVSTVCRDYFGHLTAEMFMRKVGTGEIKIPVVRMEASQKSAKGIHLADLAAYLDERRSAAVEELRKLHD